MAIHTVGFNQIGQFDSWYDEDYEDTRRFCFEMSPPFQKFTLPAVLSGICTAYYYRFEDGREQSWAIPCLYSSVNNKPYAKLTKNEQSMDIFCPTAADRGWVSATMEVDGIIAAGTVIWLGLWSSLVSPKYSVGSQLVFFSFLNVELYADVEWFLPEPVLGNIFYTHDIGNAALSLYFTYSDVPPAVVYTRKAVMVEGVTDSRNLRRLIRRLGLGVLSVRDSIINRMILQRVFVTVCLVTQTGRFWRLVTRLCSTIAGVREACMVRFLFLAVVRTLVVVHSALSYWRILERVVFALAVFWERFLWRKPLNRIEVQLFSPIHMILVLKSRL